MLPAVSGLRLPTLLARKLPVSSSRSGNVSYYSFAEVPPPPSAKQQRRRRFLKILLSGLALSLLLFTAGIIGLIPEFGYKLLPALVFGGAAYVALIATTSLAAFESFQPAKLGKNRFIGVIGVITIGALATTGFMSMGIGTLFGYLSITGHSRPMATYLLVATAATNCLTMFVTGTKFHRETDCGY